MTVKESRVGGAHTAPLHGSEYVAARSIRLGDTWRDAGYVLSGEDLAGRSIDGMLLAGDIVAAPVKGGK